MAHFDPPDQNFIVVVLDSFFEDKHFSLLSFQESIVEGVSEVQLGFLVLVEALVRLLRELILRRICLAFALGCVVAES